MMKTLCVAIVVLSLTSVCQPASLACENLLKPVDKGSDLSGTWYVIALSADVCLVPLLLKAFFWPSIEFDITAMDIPNVYNINNKINMYGYCFNDSVPAYFDQNSNNVFDADSNNLPTGKPDTLLHSGCPDCLVVKGGGAFATLALFSKRQTVTAAEMKEFEAQAECLGWSKPQVLGSDHDYETCKLLEDDLDVDIGALSSMIYKSLTHMQQEIFNCVKETFLSILSYFFD